MLWVLLLGLLAGEAVAEPPVRRVVVVSLDGLRPDAIAMTETPALDALIKRGVWAENARTILPSATLPSHASMLTGYVPGRHGVVLWNNYRPKLGKIKAPTMFGRVSRAGMRAQLVVHKQKLWHLSGGSDDFRYVKGDPAALFDGAIEALAGEPRLLFVHCAEPDRTGHRDGWLSKEQLAKITLADRGLGRLVAAATERWGEHVSWIVTSDHGGHMKTHGTPLKVDMQIPWIAAGSGIKRGVKIPASRQVRTYDTAATALALLGVEAQKLDGRAVSEALTD